MRLPSRIPLPAGLRALLAGRVKGTLRGAEPVLGSIERAFGLLHLGQGTGEGILGCGQPAPQAGQLPDRLAAFPRPFCHLTIVAGGRGCLRLRADPPGASSGLHRPAGPSS